MTRGRLPRWDRPAGRYNETVNPGGPAVQIEDYFDFSDAREIRIHGHRIWIQHVLGPYLGGMTPEQIRDEMPTLSLDKVYAAILYYQANREAVTRYMDDLRADLERQRAAQPPPGPGLRSRIDRVKTEREAQRRGEHDLGLPAR